MKKKIISILFSFSLCLDIHSAQLITGDPAAAEGTTFSFGINQTIISPFNNFYVGSNQLLTESQTFAFSRLIQGKNAFEPLAPETVVLNGTPEQPNPIFGQKITVLGMLKPNGRGDTPVIVTAAQPATLYVYADIINPQRISIMSSQQLHDAAGNVSSGIAALTTNIEGYIFSAVSPENGIFGQPNSGIALAIKGFLNNVNVLTALNAETGSYEPPFKALPLDTSSPVIAIGEPLAALTSNVSMTWSSPLESFYVGLQATSGNSTNDGARSVVVGKLKKTFVENESRIAGITLQPIAPATAFAPGNTNSLIGVIGAYQSVSVHNITTMLTSTAINYLIIVGGNGDASSTQQSVYALPLVNTGDATGTIASKNAIPVDVFADDIVQRLTGRLLTQPALMPEDMPQTTDVAVQVGGEQLPAGNITGLVVRDDTVFVSVASGNATGVYSSQALFEANGLIKAWTQWQRATGTTDQIFSTALDTINGKFIFSSGTDDKNINTIKRTQWSNGDPEGLLSVTTIVNQELALNQGGIQGLTTFIPTPLQTRIPFLAIGGIGKLILVQTGSEKNNTLIPTPADEYSSIMTFDNGTIDKNVDAKIIIFSGGELANITSLLTTAVGTDGDQSWLFVGGTEGVAILAQSNGSGFNARTGIKNNFAGLTVGMTFTNFGNYTFVKKIIADDTFLYIITNDVVDRIDLATSDFANNMIDIVTIATKDTIPGIDQKGGILDGIFSQSFGILATTAGIFRVGDNQDVRTVSNATQLQWTPVIIPENAGAPTQFLGVAQTNQTTDITRDNGGQFYALTSNVGMDQARINRFAINPLAFNQPMQSTTITPFNDLFVNDILSFFLNYGVFKSGFATDGALYFATRNQHNRQAPQAVLNPAIPQPMVGVNNVGERSSFVTINYNNGTEINALTRSQASGSWIIAGNFGMQVLE